MERESSGQTQLRELPTASQVTGGVWLAVARVTARRGERAECEDLGEAAKSPLSVTPGPPALEGPGPP